MTNRPYKILPAVLVAVTDKDRILLTRRKNTSYMDGWYSLPGGHMEENETLQECGAREIKEETGLSVKPNDLQLYRIYQNQNTPDKQYLGFIFRTNKYIGSAAIRENKSDDVSFFDLSNLPDRIVPYHLQAIKAISDKSHIEIIYTPPGAFDPSGQ